MSKEEAIEVTATVLETLPNAMVQSLIRGQRASGFGAYFGQNEEEFYPHFAGRPGFNRTFALRFESRGESRIVINKGVKHYESSSFS